ncbi:receptor-like kinase TMK3 [Miscanthus floridulus]
MPTTAHRQESTTTGTRKKGLLVLLLSCCLAAAAAVGMEPSDASAIADLVQSLATPPSSWTAGGDACTTFEGITCSASGRVTAIDLAGKGLAGTLPPSLSSLTALESLQLRGNSLTGVVPAVLGEIATLRNVSLSGNFLQGPVPRFAKGVAADDVVDGNSFCSDEPGRPCSAQVSALLRVAEGFGYPVSLARTWRGNDPCQSWQGLACVTEPDVSRIFLHAANFSGTISPAMANLTELRRLDLGENRLAGEIPDALATLPKLGFLDVTNNRLTGQLPKFRPSVRVLSDGNAFWAPSPSPSLSRDAAAAAASSKLNAGSILIVIGVLVALLVT